MENRLFTRGKILEIYLMVNRLHSRKLKSINLDGTFIDCNNHCVVSSLTTYGSYLIKVEGCCLNMQTVCDDMVFDEKHSMEVCICPEY